MPSRPAPKAAVESSGADTAGNPLAVTYLPLKSLVPYARNSRTHSRTNIQKIKASLVEYGWATAMGIADRGMLYGHGRLAAALELAEEGVPIPHNPDPWAGPTVDLSHLNEMQRRGYVIQDNRSALEAGWDQDLLRFELQELRTAGFDLGLTGFDMPELTNILAGESSKPLADEDEAAPAEAGNYKEQYGVIVMCTGEEHQKLVFEKLKGMGMDVRIVAT